MRCLGSTPSTSLNILLILIPGEILVGSLLVLMSPEKEQLQWNLPNPKKRISRGLKKANWCPKTSVRALQPPP